MKITVQTSLGSLPSSEAVKELLKLATCNLLILRCPKSKNEVLLQPLNLVTR